MIPHLFPLHSAKQGCVCAGFSSLINPQAELDDNLRTSQIVVGGCEGCNWEHILQDLYKGLEDNMQEHFPLRLILQQPRHIRRWLADKNAVHLHVAPIVIESQLIKK